MPTKKHPYDSLWSGMKPLGLATINKEQLNSQYKMTNSVVGPPTSGPCCDRLRDLSALTHQGPRCPQRRGLILFALVCVVLCAACQKLPVPPGSLSLHHCQWSTSSLLPTSGYSTGTSFFLPQIMIMPPCHPESSLKYGPPNHIGITLPEVNTSTPAAIAQCCHKLCHPCSGGIFCRMRTCAYPVSWQDTKGLANGMASLRLWCVADKGQLIPVNGYAMFFPDKLRGKKLSSTS